MAAILQQRSEAIVTLTLTNPGKRNALDVRMWQELATQFTTLSADASVRCIIVCGAEGNFAGGADIAEFPSVRASAAQGMAYHAGPIGAALAAIAACVHPTLAAIEGVCVGGGLEIACACDLRIGAADARFGIPINRLGFALAPAEMPGLLQLVGRAVALELLLEGRVFGAAEALQKGLLTRIEDDVPAAALVAARRIAAGAPLAARTNKWLINRLCSIPTNLTPEEAAAAFAPLDSADYQEGLAAFLAHRTPIFHGR
jgi:enoyl-CoA hydratase